MRGFDRDRGAALINVRRATSATSALCLCLLSGCALTVPDTHRLGETPTQEATRENNLAAHIRCEIRQAVAGTLDEESNPANPPLGDYSADWLNGWGATVSLVLTVDEKAALSPSVTINNPMKNIVSIFSSGGNVTSSQSSTQAFGASLSSEATRTETVGFFYPFADLIAEHKAILAAGKTDQSCGTAGGILVDGDLKIADFMREKILMSRVPGVLSRKKGKSPFSTFTYRVTFVVVGSGNATPAWKLERVLVSPTAPFVNGSRSRTNDLTITMGAVATDSNGATVASDAARDAHLAALIGQAVATDLQSQH
jgi:hypothetical protein